jgi:hypothetical protein
MTFNDRFIDFAGLAGPPRPLFFPSSSSAGTLSPVLLRRWEGPLAGAKQYKFSRECSSSSDRPRRGGLPGFFLLQKNAPAAPCNIRTDHTVNVSDINYFLCPLALLVGTSCSNFLALCLHSSTQTCCCPFFHFFSLLIFSLHESSSCSSPEVQQVPPPPLGRGPFRGSGSYPPFVGLSFVKSQWCFWGPRSFLVNGFY